MMDLKKMDVHVKWGGVHLRPGDDYETEYFTEGVQYTSSGNRLEHVSGKYEMKS